MYTFLNKIILIISFHRSENDSFGSSAWPICIILRILLYFKVAGFFWCYCLRLMLLFFSELDFPCSYGANLLAFTFGIPFSTGLHYRFAQTAAVSIERKKNIPFGTGFTYFSSGLKQHTKSRNSLGMSRTSHWSMRSLI